MEKYNNTQANRSKAEMRESPVSLFTKTPPNINHNDGLEVINEDIIVLSDTPDHKNVVVIPNEKSRYTDQTIEKEFDTKIWQMITPENAPIIDKETGEVVEPDPIPPFDKPTKLFIRARNYRWVTADGVNTVDRWDGHEAWVPAGIETKGKVANPLGEVKLLYCPDDHALFYPREVENYVDENGDSIREGLEWEWKLDGNIVSTKPFAMIANLRSQGSKWKEIATPHKIVCKVSNPHGSIQQEFSFVVADNVLWSNGNNYARENQGWYEFDESEYDSHHTNPVDFIDDPRYAPRQIRIKDISFSSYGTGNSRKSKFKKDPNDGDFKKEAQYRIDGGSWKKARDFFSGKDKPWRAYRFRKMPEYGKEITWTRAGGLTTTIEFKYTFRYYTGVWPFRKKYHRKYEGKKSIDVSQDTSVTEHVIDKWNISYRNERQ